MFAGAVALAAVGALFIAFGAALQERAAVAAPADDGQLRFLLRLVTRPRWLLGGLCAGVGVALHVVALSNGPVSVIQPVGTVGLLFAVLSKAVLDRRRLRPAELLASAAVIAGLAGLLLVLPHDGAKPRLDDTTALVLGLGTLGGVLVLFAVVTVADVSRTVRAGSLAGGAGVAFGVGSALVSVVGNRALSDVAAVLVWPTLLIVALLATGGAAQQQAYRMRRFALAFALLQIADPVTAAAVGVLVLGEPMPDTVFKAAWLGVSGLVIALGVLGFVRSYAAGSSGTEESSPCVS